MKRFMLFFVFLVFVLPGCILEGDLSEPTTFEEVSQPYLDQYGPPEDVYIYKSSGGRYWCSIDWWWYSKGFQVTFLWIVYDEELGWRVASTYTFPPSEEGVTR